ncbi:unnamed protein product [Sphenostylis stenocarpa]|uniref:Uncharacterized protein n=1 Tax=Sphenostylis stenocarpa TaxID=92480 RepID=A0AA86W2H4_9FABA|nr:unnamed protein product [Sphenostylis stenocarpa]
MDSSILDVEIDETMDVPEMCLKEIADIKWMKEDDGNMCGVGHSINNKDARPNWKVHAFKAKSTRPRKKGENLQFSKSCFSHVYAETLILKKMGLTMGTCAETGIKKKGNQRQIFRQSLAEEVAEGGRIAPGMSKIQITHYLPDTKLKTSTFRNQPQVKKINPLKYTVHFISVLERMALAEMGRYF